MHASSNSLKRGNHRPPAEIRFGERHRLSPAQTKNMRTAPMTRVATVVLWKESCEAPNSEEKTKFHNPVACNPLEVSTAFSLAK